MNVDLKGMNAEFYRRVCGWRYEPVLETIKAAVGKCLVEVTTLLIPGHNDNPQEIETMVNWLADLSSDIPLHFSRYFPTYHFQAPPTPEETLIWARELALKRLKYVYVGNVRLPGAEDTHCKGCGRVIIRRVGYRVGEIALDGNRCTHCGTENLVVN
jgi:pyruvate formate lyase activating enzyme